MLYLFKGCGKCEGDFLMDSDEWRCFQCGRVYYPTRTPEEQQLGRVAVQERCLSAQIRTGPRYAGQPAI